MAPIGINIKTILDVERNPRIIKNNYVSEMEESGNKAISRSSYLEADDFYTRGINKISENSDNPDDIEVHVWQLYSNRCAARIKCGNLHEALDDAVMANKLAPEKEIKPLLRCVEALSALWYNKEAKELLINMIIPFPESEQHIRQKIDLLEPKCTIRVGNGLKYTEIADAVNDAPAMALILVEPGIYTKPIFIKKPITIQCTSVNDNAAIDSISNSNDGDWAKLIAKDAQIAVFVDCESFTPVHIVGLYIDTSKTALVHCRGTLVIRNCVLNSTSKVVMYSASHLTSRDNPQSSSYHLIVESSLVRNGTQCGMDIYGGTKLSMKKVHCCFNGMIGLTVRDKAYACLSGCQFYGNGLCGMMLSRGRVTGTKCHFFSSNYGVSSAGRANLMLSQCTIRDTIVGVGWKENAVLHINDCEIYQNKEDGVVIEEKALAIIEECRIYLNKGRGITVTDDHTGWVSIIKNHVYDNGDMGIYIGNPDYTLSSDNKEGSNFRDTSKTRPEYIFPEGMVPRPGYPRWGQ